MDTYKLRDIGATVNTFGDEYHTFSDVLNDMIRLTLDWILATYRTSQTHQGGIKISKKAQKSFA